jgi:hypothetical protein
MTDDRKLRLAEQLSSAAKPPGLTSETVEAIKAQILFGDHPRVGFASPPVSTRFQKGQSGNPRGRPPKRAPEAPAVHNQAVNAAILKQANRDITVRDGEQTRTITAIEAVQRAQYQAALKGNPHAQKHLLDTYAQAKREEDARLAAEVTEWRERKERLQESFAAAAARGEPPPTIVHPDDIIIDPAKGVRFIGPIDEDELAEMRERCGLRDVLIYLDELSRRQGNVGPSGESYAILMFFQLQNTMPERFRLTSFQTVQLMMQAQRLNKKPLLEEIRRRFAAAGKPLPKGEIRYPGVEMFPQHMRLIEQTLATLVADKT